VSAEFAGEESVFRVGDAADFYADHWFRPSTLANR
jgi:hypothetical protein